MNQSTKSSNSYMQCDKICSFGASLNWVDYIVSHKPKHNFLTIWCSHLVDLGRYLKSMFRVQVHVVMRRFVQCEHSKIASNVLDLRNFVSISVAVHFNRRFIRMNVLQIKSTHTRKQLHENNHSLDINSLSIFIRFGLKNKSPLVTETDCIRYVEN